MTKSRGISMTAESVQAILAGTKTQTRRLVRIDDTPISKTSDDAQRLQRGIPSNATNVRFLGPYLKCDAPPRSRAVSSQVVCPYGVAGDRLWCREAFAYSVKDPDSAFNDEYDAEHYDIVYRADAEDVGAWTQDEWTEVGLNQTTIAPPWRPARHMPRWTSRITLELTAVRVQRLQEISEADAQAEGVGPEFEVDFATFVRGGVVPPSTYVLGYKHRWDEINGKTAPWASNPWVWCLTFRRVP
jgi:hypothetical protein